jgi:DNA polymerase III epsilon subunit-like protein
MIPAKPPILVVDIETTSASRRTAGIVEIGAIWLHSEFGVHHGQHFEVKCRPYRGAPICAEAIAVNGCDWLEDPTVASETEAMDLFFDWIASSLKVPELRNDDVIMAGMNVGVFDWLILEAAADRSENTFPFSFRTVDLHALAMQEAYRVSLEGITGAGLKSKEILELLGLPAEPKPHRALCGALLEHRAISELLGLTPSENLGTLESRFFPAP